MLKFAKSILMERRKCLYLHLPFNRLINLCQGLFVFESTPAFGWTHLSSLVYARVKNFFI